MQALKRYESLHYDSISKEAPVDVFQKAGTDSKYKYVYAHVGSSGLGNRLLNIISSFVLALITDRVLVVYSPHYDLQKVFCEPFPNSSWILPHEVKVPGGKMVDQYGLTLETTDFKTLDTQIIQMRDVEQYFMTQLFVNKHLIGRLNELFPGRNVGTVISKYLLHPVNEIWADILHTFEHRDSNILTVGLQVRHPAVSATAMLTCLPPLPQTAHIFIASLGNLVQEVKNAYPTWNVTQRFVEGGERHDLTQVKTALHDIFLLSMCDKVVISVRSTFGYMIMALKGSLCPIYGNSLHDSGVNKETCSWPNSHEICHHGGFAIMKQLNDSGAINYNPNVPPAIYTGPCVDISSGIRLNTARD